MGLITRRTFEEAADAAWYFSEPATITYHRPIGAYPQEFHKFEKPQELEQVQGYRVQVFVSSNRENAQKIKVEAEEIFPERVYVPYDAPYYKVRVGDCLTRREAELLLEKAVRHGYRDAWVVRTLVNQLKE